jgi:hydroxyethylthiazole kinase-like uncharacterized protein yjeF
VVKRIDKVPTNRPLPRDVHKGDRGRVLLVAGSLSMSGAARLAGWGALRGGAGLLTIGTPECVQPIVAADLPCAMTLPLPSRRGALTATGVPAALAVNADVVGIGPGLTTGVLPFLRKFRITCPVVVDADALNVLAENPEIRRSWRGPCVLTPHPGEAERLLERKIERTAKARMIAAQELADRFDAIVVLKGAGTVVTDGERYFLNRTGNPGMATGGTGDVLTGLVAGMIAGLNPGSGLGEVSGRADLDTQLLATVIQAVHAHGRAGDLACAAMGERSMIATDLVANLPAAVGELVVTPSRSGKRTGSRRRG